MNDIRMNAKPFQRSLKDVGCGMAEERPRPFAVHVVKDVEMSALVDHLGLQADLTQVVHPLVCQRMVVEVQLS